MSTQEVAARLVELFNQGQPVQAEQELYADGVVSYEQDLSMEPAKGKEAIITKTQWFVDNATVAKAEATVAFVNRDTFLVVFDMDVELPHGPMKGLEYGFYRVAEGKVVEEYFYMMPM